MKRENLDFLESEQIDKVMALYGKAITKKDNEIENLTNSKRELEEKVATYETKINEFNESAKDNADWKTKYEELQTSIKEQEAKAKAEEEDKILTNNIIEAIGDKKFVNDYTKNSIVNEVKTALQDKANAGKSAKELFENLTKDRSDVFVSENQIKDMDGMGDVDDSGDKTGVGEIKLNSLFKNYN